jgi:hypothetical protein
MGVFSWLASMMNGAQEPAVFGSKWPLACGEQCHHWSVLFCLAVLGFERLIIAIKRLLVGNLTA